MKKINTIASLCLTLCFLASCYDETKQASIKISVGSTHIDAAQTYIDEVSKKEVLEELGMSTSDILTLGNILEQLKVKSSAIRDIFFSDISMDMIPAEILQEFNEQEKIENPQYYYLTELKYKHSSVFTESTLNLTPMILQNKNSKAGLALMGMSAAANEVNERWGYILDAKLRTFSDYPVEDVRIGPLKTTEDYALVPGMSWKLTHDLFEQVYGASKIMTVDSVQSFQAWTLEHANKLKKEGIMFDQSILYQAPNWESVEKYFSRQ